MVVTERRLRKEERGRESERLFFSSGSKEIERNLRRELQTIGRNGGDELLVGLERVR